ncbi:MAG: shikimate dehydrogenase [Desulfobacula sp.]|jgi:shikimate dehydrogenase
MINSFTQLYGVFGNPVRHSKSPIIHNFIFQYHNINAVYLAFEPDLILKGIGAIKALNIKGASITLPFKESIIDHLDWIDEDAAAIGAVNTVVNKEGFLQGFNTDYKAAVEPLKSFGIKGKKICIIGAGGAAQAVAFGIHKEKGHLVIVNRNIKRGETLAEKYNADFYPFDDKESLHKIQPDILINTTPVGMTPNISDLSFPLEHLNHTMIVMDIIYNPLKTRLLYEAQTKGCTTIDGLAMFLHQGAHQVKLWTGVNPDIELMRKAFLKGDNS